jgi:CBS domain-containing protein
MDPVPGLDLTLPPFDLLDAAGQARVQSSVDVGFHRAGQTLIQAGQASPHVFVILKGRIRAFDQDGEREQLFADYGPGDVFGAWAVMAGRARHSYRTETDSLCFLIPAAVFQRLLADYPRFAAYFNEGLATKGQLAAGSSELAELLLGKVGDAQLAPAATIAADASIAEATALLHEKRVDCLLVQDRAHAAPGIVTRTDLLEALALQRLPLAAPVGPLAHRPLISVGTGDVLFQALVSMTGHQIERVAVTDGAQVIGTLGMAEVLAHYASHSHLISLRLARAATLPEIADAARGMTTLIRTLHLQGIRMPYLMELVSALNSRIMGRIFELLVPPEHADRICLLVMGSEGRGEQLLKTDQDNALVLADDLDWPQLPEAMAAFSEALAQMGYPPCPGGVMVNRAHWRLPVSGWRQRIEHWRRNHGGDAALDLSIALDARPIAGNLALFAPVREAMETLGEDEILLHHLAQAMQNFQTPLTLLGQVRGDAHGTDLKKGGVFPVVHGLRCLALRHRIGPRNSFERCAALHAAGALPAELARDLPQALSVFHRLRLGEQLQALQEGRAADNHVRVDRLRRLDRELLRDALRVVKEFRQHVRISFHLSD